MEPLHACSLHAAWRRRRWRRHADAAHAQYSTVLLQSSPVLHSIGTCPRAFSQAQALPWQPGHGLCRVVGSHTRSFVGRQVASFAVLPCVASVVSIWAEPARAQELAASKLRTNLTVWSSITSRGNSSRRPTVSQQYRYVFETSTTAITIIKIFHVLLKILLHKLS